MRWVIDTCLHSCAVNLAFNRTNIVYLLLFWLVLNLLFLPEASRQRYIPPNCLGEAGSKEDDG